MKETMRIFAENDYKRSISKGESWNNKCRVTYIFEEYRYYSLIKYEIVVGGVYILIGVKCHRRAEYQKLNLDCFDMVL